MNKHHRSSSRAPAEPLVAVGEGIRNRVRLKIDSAGRVLIPASIREAMGLEEGNVVLAWLKHGELRLVGAKAASAHAQRLARELIAGPDSLADQLIADRREEAKREGKNG
jgi:AbrB family looped-hinge helix DNA binding protein